MSRELFQRVALTRDVEGQHLCAGDIAYLIDHVPHPDGSEPGCVLEVFNALGESIAILTVPESFIEPLSADEILSVRHLPEIRNLDGTHAS
ncbi:MAG: DUF4926 domain-containing protein [Planctomycetaceae bacterium]